jgi:hypothetical protein
MREVIELQIETLPEKTRNPAEGTAGFRISPGQLQWRRTGRGLGCAICIRAGYIFALDLGGQLE